MDPLSIAASFIAVGQAAATGGNLLRKLIDLRKAPEELLALFNELEALQCDLTLLRQTQLRLEGNTLYEDAREPLQLLLRQVQQAVQEFNALLEYRLKQSESLDKHGNPDASKSGWLTAAHKLDALKQRIRDANARLILGLQASNLSISEATRQTAVQIQSISLTTGQDHSRRLVDMDKAVQDVKYHSTQTLAVVAGTRRTLDMSMQRLVTDVKSSNAQTADGLCALYLSQRDGHAETTAKVHRLAEQVERLNARLASERLLSDPVEGSSSSTGVSPTVCITTSVSIRRCPRLCKCQCHKQTYGQTPRWLRSIVGQLLFSYTSIINPKPCNYPPCRQDPRKSHFTYYFPSWMASRALLLSGIVRDLSGPGASWALKIPAVIPSGDVVWWIVGNGNIEGLQKRIAQGKLDAYIVNEDGDTLLHRAIDNLQPKLFQFLLDQGIDPTIENVYRQSALSELMSMGQLENYNVNDDVVTEGLDFTALHEAIVRPSSENHLTESLLQDHFSDVNTPDRMGMTPLHWASRMGNSKSVRLLLTWHANVDARDHRGLSALHHACCECFNQESIECVRAILESGFDVNVNAADLWGQSPLFHCANPDVVDLLMSHGALVSLRDKDRSTPLHGAASFNHGEAVGKLLQHGAEYAAQDIDGRTPSQLAVIYDYAESLAALIRWSTEHANIDDAKDLQSHWPPDKWGSNVLHFAALKAGPEVMTVLAQSDLRGLDPLTRDIYGYTPEDCFYKHRDQLCTIVRPPFEEEEAAWKDLMRAVRFQTDLGMETDTADTLGCASSEAAQRKCYILQGDEDWESSDREECDGSEDDSDSIAEERRSFVDAEEGVLADGKQSAV